VSEPPEAQDTIQPVRSGERVRKRLKKVRNRKGPVDEKKRGGGELGGAGDSSRSQQHRRRIDLIDKGKRTGTISSKKGSANEKKETVQEGGGRKKHAKIRMGRVSKSGVTRDGRNRHDTKK